MFQCPGMQSVRNDDVSAQMKSLSTRNKRKSQNEIALGSKQCLKAAERLTSNVERRDGCEAYYRTNECENVKGCLSPGGVAATSEKLIVSGFRNLDPHQ